MQKQKKPVPEVVKPVLIGSWHGKDAVQQGFKVMLNIIFVSVVYVILGLLLSFDSLLLRILTGLMLLLAGGTYLYSTGMGIGQADAAFSEIMYQRKQEGKTITQADQDKCFHVAKGFFSAAVGVAPYVLLALVFAIMTRPETYTLGVLPGWLTPYTRQSGMGDALAYYQVRDGISALSILRVVVRSLTMPVINIAVKVGDTATLWAEWLSPLWIMLAPLGYGLGYMQGIRLRTRINTGIAIGDQKKKRRERKERRARAKNSAPERLI